MEVVRGRFTSGAREDRAPHLWGAWLEAVQGLRPACSRTRTFLWLVLVLAGFCLRPDLAGVTSLVRGLDLAEPSYFCLLHFFHSAAVHLDALTPLWVTTLLQLLGPHLVRVRGRPVALVDGLKRPKEGKKMPGVKSLHQASRTNAKPTYLMGHSLQAIALLVQAAGSCRAVPVSARIHEGLRWNRRQQRTLIDKLATEFLALAWSAALTVVADAYYAVGKLARRLLSAGHHLVTRPHTNAVAYFPPDPPKARQPKRRGRPRTYGLKTRLRDWFDYASHFRRARSPVYGETHVWLRYYSYDLLWRPLGQLVRYVWVVHPTRGRLILLCTDLTLDPLEIIRLYGWRFKIEVSFKAAIHTLGTYAYHFWMRTMKPIRRGGGDQPLRHRPAAYRQAVGRKLAAYHLHIQLGLIAQGLLQYLAVAFRPQVWARSPSYLRTASPQNSPSEWVTAQALRHSWLQFLRNLPRQHILKKFLDPKINPNPCPYAELVQMEEAA